MQIVRKSTFTISNKYKKDINEKFLEGVVKDKGTTLHSFQS